MQEIIFIDEGSLPTPEGVTREWVKAAAENRDEDEKLFSIIGEALQRKIDVGVHVPTYPQFRDMIGQFLDIIKDEKNCSEPYVLKEENAKILELEIVDEVAKQYKKETGKTLEVRVCIAGPTDLYLQAFGATAFEDAYHILAQDVEKFVKQAFKTARNFKIKVIALDEISLGLTDMIQFSDADIKSALTVASTYARQEGADMEIHVYSPLKYELICETPINIIGFEYAGNPSYLDLLDRKVLEDSDTYVGVGIARTDIFSLVNIVNEKYGINAWKEKVYMQKTITELETPDVIKKRLDTAYSVLGDRIKYANPDCGLAFWPDQDIAFRLFENTAKAVNEFNEEKKDQ
ncbi:5-methyltetrahydropteroyltriglutamate-- homocysteine methyltransferase [Methanosarcina siciliae T4/M]|uniref:5-methyltetrahydropteroyltriglutamate--homocysteine methyltransferase n=2 Tax=Methanosarcina siciliae TaxID=38027 RepID=A0A0E3PBQ1_9EURY|nr:methionine synthase [Methanosarcina siciliae]AKB27724.1 5-methyltetrahydropteroyltriglutamate-- homocysteine methyltransferase [Methanosarcina siciliae T4/M]AKB31662.1 5-methyltetrahydropteroyltriglutamate-- homocysteine methyltransferase [Methanosarcina siciliae HI350]